MSTAINRHLETLSFNIKSPKKNNIFLYINSVFQCYNVNMKTMGEILSTLFDKQFAEKAMGYSKFFNSWADITEKNGIGAAAAHSRIKDVDKGMVLIEMDHPGWKQILQTKQSKLLNDFRFRFPEMNITAISLILSRGDQAENYGEEAQKCGQQAGTEHPVSYSVEQSCDAKDSTINSLDSIKDEEFKEKLKRLGEIIKENEKGKK